MPSELGADGQRRQFQRRQFQRHIEDFSCAHCGATVTGDGYTNHCPSCLWSRHVDIHPGDRAAECGGLMEPVVALLERGEFVVTHRCVSCGQQRRNKSARADDRTALMALAAPPSDLPPPEFR